MKTPVLLASFLLLLVSRTSSTCAFLQHRPPPAVFRPSHPLTRECKKVTTTKLGGVQDSIDPALEAAVCISMAHVTLDLIPLDVMGITSPSQSHIRLYAIVGRLLLILADYLPDHAIQPDELMFQSVLLALALKRARIRTFLRLSFRRWTFLKKQRR